MKTRTHILSLGMAGALIGTMLLPAPQAQAGGDRGLIVAGAVIGGVLGYIAGEHDGHCGRVVVHSGVYHHPAPVVVHHPVVVHRPVVVYREPPVVVHRPVVVYRQPPVVVHRPRPVVVYTHRHDRHPSHGTGHSRGRR